MDAEKNELIKSLAKSGWVTTKADELVSVAELSRIYQIITCEHPELWSQLKSSIIEYEAAGMSRRFKINKERKALKRIMDLAGSSLIPDVEVRYRHPYVMAVAHSLQKVAREQILPSEIPLLRYFSELYNDNKLLNEITMHLRSTLPDEIGRELQVKESGLPPGLRERYPADFHRLWMAFRRYGSNSELSSESSHWAFIAYLSQIRAHHEVIKVPGLNPNYERSR